MAALYDWLTSSAQRQGNARALVHRDTYLSWRGLVHRVDRRAQELRTLGISEGAWVGLMLGNVPELVVLALALDKVGAVMVLLDPTTSVRDLDMMMDAAPLRALVTRPQSADAAAPLTPVPATSSAPLRLVNGARVVPPKFAPEARRRLQGTLLVCNLYKRDNPPPVIDDVAPTAVLFTSDTGGDVKGVLRGVSHLQAVAETARLGLELTARSRILVTAPLHHGYAFDMGLMAGLATGCTMVLEDEISPRHLTRALREESFDVVLGTAALYAAFAKTPLLRPPEDERTGRFLCSGSPLPPSVAQAFAARFGVRPRSCYHTTETGPVALEDSGERPELVGTPLPGVEVRITSIEGGKLAPGVKGQVWVRSRAVSNVSVPKLGVPIRAVGRAGVPIGRADASGWFRTGDLGRIDGEGRLELQGREDDLVKVDGKRVALGEVAGCLESFSRVRAADARLEYDDLGDPRVIARVVSQGDVRPEDLIDHCARNLAPYKVPRAIEFCTEL